MKRIANFKSKKELAYEALRTEILEGRLAPGERLIIADLAEKLGVSHIPVREALQSLETEGFVVIKPNAGATVAEIHHELITEIFLLLEALETISFRFACVRMTDEDFEAMRSLLVEMDGLIEDQDAWSTKNTELHWMLMECADTPLAKNIMSTVMDHWDRLRRHFAKGVFLRRIADAQKEHWAFFEALKARDGALAEQIAREHNRAALKAYAKYAEKLESSSQVKDAQ